MKNLLFWGILGACTLPSWASDEAIFEAAFHGMFEPQYQQLELRATEPMPPVPLDGGMWILIVGGVAAARKRLRR